METSLIRKVLSGVFAFCLAPVLLAARPSSNSAGTATSATPSGKMEASHLLNHVQAEAYKVQKDADQLHTYLSQPGLYDSQFDGYFLDEARYRVNTMDSALHQLWAMRGKASKTQQKAIDRIAPTVVDLTDTTQLAITSFNRNRPHLYTSQLKAYTEDMYMQAKLIRSSVEEFQRYSNDRRELHQLRQKLHIKRTS